MRKLRVGVIDLVTKGPERGLYSRAMNANLVSIMPQVVAVWCEQHGHDVTFVCFTGYERLSDELPDDVDLVFIGAFTEAAQLAYALSHLFQIRGAVTVLGGPHARCYPEDAQKYFDYVLGFTDEIGGSRCPRRLFRAPADGSACRSRPPTGGVARRRGAVAIHRTDAAKGADHQSRADDRESGMSVHLQLLHRLGNPLPAIGVRSAEERLAVSTHEAEASARRLARPELRRAIQRLHGRDRRGGAARSHRLHCREQSVAAVGAASEAAKEEGFKAILPGIESWYGLGDKSRPVRDRASTKSGRSPSTST